MRPELGSLFDERMGQNRGLWIAAISCRGMSEFRGLRRHFFPTSARGAVRTGWPSRSLFGPRSEAVRRAARHRTVGHRTLVSAISIITESSEINNLFLIFSNQWSLRRLGRLVEDAEDRISFRLASPTDARRLDRKSARPTGRQVPWWRSLRRSWRSEGPRSSPVFRPGVNEGTRRRNSRRRRWCRRFWA
jgi:hypothetical protein